MLKKALRQALPVAALLALVLVLWLPALIDQARDVDVLLYAAAAARANAEGALPYTSTWIEKGPLAMGLYQGLFALFGPYNLAAIALTWLALALATLWMVAVLCRALGGGPWWGALLFAAALPAVGGSLNTEVPAAAAAMAAALIWLRSRQRGSGQGLVVLAGLLAGVAFLCRQNAGILAPVLVLGELLTCGAALPWRQRLLRPLLLTGGFVALPAVTVVLYAGLGHLDVFLFCFHSYNVEIYIAATRVTGTRLLLAPWEAVKNFLLPLPTTAALGLAGLGAALAGPGSWRRGDPVRGSARLVTALAAIGLVLSVFAGLRFFSHYFALALPFWAALGGWFMAAATAHLRRAGVRQVSARFQPLAGAILVPLVALSLLLEVSGRPWYETLRRSRDWVVSGRILQAADPLAWPRRDGLATAAARYILANSSATDRVFVWGMRPHVQVYARRIAATRFVTSTFLAGVVPWERIVPADGTDQWIVPGAWDLFAADIARDRPLFIVDAGDDHLFGHGAHPPQRYPQLGGLLGRDYRQVAAFGEEDRLVLWQRIAGEAGQTPAGDGGR